MSEIKINAALVAGLTAAALGIPTANEGKDFTKPAVSLPWASWFNLPADTDVASLGQGGMDETVGVFQVDLNYPLNDGTGNILAAVQKLRDYFVAGRRLVYQGQCVKVERVTRNNLRPVNGWQQINVSIYYSANTVRPEV
ncbi:phage tail terminator-like protein [Pseudomonas sp. JS3066]|uniref:phage tail terminator-like protein n=1 Tax=Pseudomonas sp. JS3066 TaxID=3090665 RepID=UPI002E7B7698|nr:phage tail terminator-like protein [Pseudomonas sp. JS3066]WVK90888.1 phage tail terminator-like protein [Pseudomonas sp. JS3066]